MIKKGTTSLSEIKSRLRTPPDESIGENDTDYGRKPLAVSTSTVRHWLKLMSYKQGKGQKGFEVTDQRKARIREYLIGISKALCQERNGNRIVVYTDESYINVNHRQGKKWRLKDAKSEHPSGKGKRLIIVNAITKNALSPRTGSW